VASQLQGEYDRVVDESTMLKIKWERAEETLLALEPEHKNLNKAFNSMLEENEMLVQKIEEICTERDEYRRVILESGQETLLLMQRKSSVLRESLSMVDAAETRPSTPKRSNQDVERHVKALAAEINEDHQLTRANERLYMQHFADLLSGTVRSIGPAQADALLGIRYEFLRREVTIKMMIKEMHGTQAELESVHLANEELQG